MQKGTQHTDNIVIRWKLGRGGLWTNAEWQYNKHKGSICMGTTEDHWMHRVSNTSSKHVLAQLHEQKKQNAREYRSLTDALAQVPHKTVLHMKECWLVRMHWCVCIIILKTLFVVHKHPLLLSPYYALFSRKLKIEQGYFKLGWIY